MVIDVLKNNVLICRRHVCFFMHILRLFLSSLILFRYRLLGHGRLVCILKCSFLSLFIVPLHSCPFSLLSVLVNRLPRRPTVDGLKPLNNIARRSQTKREKREKEYIYIPFHEGSS